MSKKEKNRIPTSRTVGEFYPKNDKQDELIHAIKDSEVVVCSGIAGTGKTYVTLATALQLLGPKYRKIYLVKSLTTIPGENVGFLPGDKDEKVNPYMISFSWTIDKLCGKNAFKEFQHTEIVETLPLAFVRGISIDNSIVIIDEAQNLDKHTFKTIMTRIGHDSKYVFLGDTEQVDRKKKQESSLQSVLEIFRDSDIVGTVEFGDEDCVRNSIIPPILEKLREGDF